MVKVTNKYDGLLNVAGVDVRASATVEVDDVAFKKWSGGGAAKIWLEKGIVVVDSKKAPKEADGDKTDDDKSGATSGDGDERETLLTEARELGLNPNANTGIEKLKKAIAEKKAENA